MFKSFTISPAVFIGVLIISFSAQAQTVSLMSYNVGSSNWLGNRDSVVARVVFNNPDIFCAIEATGMSRPFLETSLADYNLLQTFVNPNLCESHIFYRKNMFTVIDSGFVEMDTYGGYMGPRRYVNWARFEETTNQNQFIVYASHFLYVWPNNIDSGDAGQYRHADGMVQLMDQHNFLNIPLITVGDFNADSAKPVMQFLVHQTPVTYLSITINNPVLLDDSWYVANPTTKKPGTVGSTQSGIDWILTSPDTDVTYAIIDDQGVNGSGVYPSDHKPLVIHFEFPDTISSISEISINIKPSLFPNPFQNSTKLRLEGIYTDGDGTFEINIFNIKGQLVMHKMIIKNESNLEVDLLSGMYLYTIKYQDTLINGGKFILY